MRTRRMWAVMVALAGVMLATFINFVPQIDGDSSAQMRNSPVDSKPIGTIPLLQPAKTGHSAAPRHAVSFSSEVSDLRQEPTEDGATLALLDSTNNWMDGVIESVENATVDEFRETRKMAEQGDAVAAYWLHVFFSHCDNSPRTYWQLERRLSGIQGRVDRLTKEEKDPNLEQLLKEIDQNEQSYQLCSSLDPDFDTQTATLRWLETAADLGHMGAQRVYHFYARHLILGNSSNLAFQQPGLIAEFKLRAGRYARALLDTGHPQAYLLASEMFYAGDVYQRDYVKSYAYALAADIIGTDDVRELAKFRLILAELKLSSTSQMAKTERLAREILRE